MANSIKQYTGDGVTGKWLAPQEFLDASHIRVTVNAVELTQGVDFEVISESGSLYVELDSSYHALTDPIVVWRNTPVSGLVVFTNGATYDANDQNMAYYQCLYAIEELREQ